MLHDTFGRTIDYLRISLTDRCNLRCLYCMPEEGVPSLCQEKILRLEEIERIVSVAAKCGIKHLRLTGGEPLVRKGITDLIYALKRIPGIESIALTTNGILLPPMAAALKEAGLDRVNISLDSLDAAQYHAITRRGNLKDALAGIEAAFSYGFDPVKINVVVVRHLQQDFAAFARLTLDKPLHVRFIEFMPIGHTTCPPDNSTCMPAQTAQASSDIACTSAHAARMPATFSQEDQNQKALIPWSSDDVVFASEIRTLLQEALDREHMGSLVPLSKAPTGWGPASYLKIAGAQGSIGFISALSNHFCASCNRLRLTADGKLRPCLFSDEEFDIREAVRSGSEKDIQQIFDKALRKKPESHHYRQGTKRSMSQVGG